MLQCKLFFVLFLKNPIEIKTDTIGNHSLQLKKHTPRTKAITMTTRMIYCTLSVYLEHKNKEALFEAHHSESLLYL